jgi:hypothetical protein
VIFGKRFQTKLMGEEEGGRREKGNTHEHMGAACNA